MEFKNHRLSIREAKQIDLVYYLRTLGFEPVKNIGNDYWYRSPLRNERTPSFKVSRKLNVWYDHGLGKGGTIIDFGVLYHRCQVADLLRNLAGSLFLQPPPKQPPDLKPERENQVIIKDHFPLSSPALIQYLQARKIDLDVAMLHCQQVVYEIGDRHYFAIGFQNDKGGFELRNQYIKLASKPKAVTTIKNGADRALVFEGFFDFLSLWTIYKTTPFERYDSIVLNSTAFLHQTLPQLLNYKRTGLFLDNGTGGRKCTELALQSGSNFIDQSHLYKNYDDLNDYLVRSGTSKKLRL